MKPTDTKNLSWKDAWWYLLNLKKVRRHLWKGYWSWEKSPKDNLPTIMMHCRDGSICDIRDTDFVAYTFSNIAQRDWEVVDENEPISIQIEPDDIYISKSEQFKF